MKCLKGSSHIVILLGDFAFKFPRPSSFREGMRQNRNEWKHRSRSKYLAHLYYSAPLGFLNIMEGLAPLGIEFENLDIGFEFLENHYKNLIQDEGELDFILSDGQYENFGRRVNEIIKCDWGL